MSPMVESNAQLPWWKDRGIRNLNFLLLGCYLGAIANGYISGLISSLIANPKWYDDFQGLSSTTMLGLVVAAQPLGCIAAFFPAPWLTDKYGRRVGVLVGNAGMTAGFIGQAFSKSPGQFLAMRLLVGFSSIFNTMSSAALLLELAHPRQRSVAGALFNTFFFVGSTTAAWVSYGSLRISNSWSWRLPVTLQLLWTVAQLPIALAFPESPNWLVRNGKDEEAVSILAKYHANGNAEDLSVLAELSMIRTSTELRNQSHNVGWLALCATPGNRKRLLLSVVIGVATQWVGNGIITFYLSPVLRTIGISSSIRQQGINGGLQIYNWCLAISAALMAEKLGRLRLFLTSAGAMLVFMSMVTLCSAFYARTASLAAGYAVIVFLFLFMGGYVIGLTPIPILYINEIWPSHLRAKGASVFWISQAVATCFNQYVNPVALQKLVWKYYLVYVGVLIVVVVFMFFCVPETKGLTSEGISSLFDGPRGEATELSDLEHPDPEERS